MACATDHGSPLTAITRALSLGCGSPPSIAVRHQTIVSCAWLCTTFTEEQQSTNLDTITHVPLHIPNLLSTLPIITTAATLTVATGGRAQEEQRVCINHEHSLVHWVGTKVGGHHEGTVQFADGYLIRKGSNVSGGLLTVDMRSIDVTDIPAQERQARHNLLAHLAGDEFLAADRFPQSSLTLRTVDVLRPGEFRVSGVLAIRDSVHLVGFDVSAPVVTPDTIRASTQVTIDRRRWGIRFDGLTSLIRNAIVHNEFTISVELLATTDACEGRSSSAPSRERPPAGDRADADGESTNAS